MSRSALLIGNFLSSRGYSRQFIEELAVRLGKIGWRCTTASTIVWRPGRLFDMMQRTLRSVRRVSVVYLPVFSGPSFIWVDVVTLIVARTGTPLVLSLNGGNLPEFAQRHPRRTRRVLRRASIVVCPSPYLQNALRAYHPGIRIVPNPVDISRHSFRERARPEPRLVWIRSFHAIYNPALGPRVLALVRQRFPDARLTMFGFDSQDGSRWATEQEAARLGVAGAVSFPGGLAKTDVPAALETNDIFINTTNIDNTPVSVLEAMASGLPVVTTDVGGISQFLVHEQEALLVPPDDPSAMADAVIRVLTDDRVAGRLSRAGRTKAASCDWRGVIGLWDSILTEASGRDAGRV